MVAAALVKEARIMRAEIHPRAESPPVVVSPGYTGRRATHWLTQGSLLLSTQVIRNLRTIMRMGIWG